MSARITAAEASDRIRRWLDRRKAHSHTGDTIHGLDVGTEYETMLAESDLRAIIDRPLQSRGFIVGKKGKGSFSHVVAVFDIRPLAEAWAESANRWYGEDHPLTPLTVWTDEVFLNPKPFPDPNGSVEDIFKDIDK